MDEVIEVENQYYIRATSERVDDRTRVLKHGETFALFDRRGDIARFGRLGEQGIYFEGTRFLSRLELLLNDRRPMLLSSTVNEDNALLAVDLSNPDIMHDGDVVVPSGTLHLFRATFLWDGCCYERLRISNHGQGPVEARLTLRFDADFVDIFEVRGARRERHGTRRAEVRGREAHLVYEGLDGVTRRARVMADPAPTVMTPNEVTYQLRLPPQATEAILLVLAFETGHGERQIEPYDEAFRLSSTALALARAREPQIQTSNEQFNDWLKRSAADLHMMISQTGQGSYPYAGVPWFSTPFGRDGIITALEYLWLAPALAQGVLRYLARTQADAVDPERDAEPGKILHETRRGEMAALGEIPFGRYYGGADTTPLFVLLAGAYFERTADLDTIRELWPHVERALEWMRIYGDPDGDGFLEYARRSSAGLVNQGWKDSNDSVFHADGSLAEPPIALVEIQGYGCAAYRAAALLAEALGLEERVPELRRRSERLRVAIEESFWWEEMGTYALALDGAKRPCRVLASNAGHLLFCGVPAAERALRLSSLLLGDHFYSGWGIRTVAETEARYNPISYHNGSIWPHDNALIAAGLARYGEKDAACRLLTGLFDASLFVELHRMPELFCGFPRRPGQGPTSYPVACAPQSWAAASVYLLLQSCLGLTVNASRREIQLFHPRLPPSLREVRISNFRVGEASLDLELIREGDDVGSTIARRDGPLNVIVVK